MKNKKLENIGMIVGTVAFIFMLIIAWRLNGNAITQKESIVYGLVDFAFYGLAILVVTIAKSDTLTLYMKDERKANE